MVDRYEFDCLASESGARLRRRPVRATKLALILAIFALSTSEARALLVQEHGGTQIASTLRLRNRELAVQVGDSVDHGSGDYRLLLFSGALPSLDALRDADLLPLHTIPPQGLAVRLGRRASIDSLEGLVWAGVLTSEDKVSKAAAEELRGDGPEYRLLIEAFPDVSRESLALEIRRHGGQVELQESFPPHVAVVVGTRRTFSLLLQESNVTWISLPPEGVAHWFCPGAKGPYGFVPDYADFAIGDDGWEGPGHGSSSIHYLLNNVTSQLPADLQYDVFQQALEIWGRYAAVSFLRGSGPGPLIELTWVGNSTETCAAPGALACAAYPASGGDIAIGLNWAWSINDEPDSPLTEYDLFSVLAHEAGHALGLAHSDLPSALMYYAHTRPFVALTSDDIEGIRSIYSWNIWDHDFDAGEGNGSYRHFVADFNGDGRADLMQLSRGSSVGWIGLAGATGDFETWTGSFAAGEAGGSYHHHVGDMNGDGRADLVQLSANGTTGWVGLSSSNGIPNVWSSTFPTGEASGNYRHYLADVNGDGRDDLIQISVTGLTGWIGLAGSDGTPAIWSSSFATGEASGAYRHYLTDVNGDGRSDLVQIATNASQGWIGLASSNGTFELWTHTFPAGGSSGAYVQAFADVNGDGSSDLIQLATATAEGWVGLSNPSGSFEIWSGTFSAGGAQGAFSHVFADVNGDGSSDLMQYSTALTNGWIGLGNSNGEFFQTWSHQLPTGGALGAYVLRNADVNGDGRKDLVQIATNALSGHTAISGPTGAPQLSAVSASLDTEFSELSPGGEITSTWNPAVISYRLPLAVARYFLLYTGPSSPSAPRLSISAQSPAHSPFLSVSTLSSCFLGSQTNFYTATNRVERLGEGSPGFSQVIVAPGPFECLVVEVAADGADAAGAFVVAASPTAAESGALFADGFESGSAVFWSQFNP